MFRWTGIPYSVAMEENISNDVKRLYLNFKVKPCSVAKLRVDAIAFGLNLHTSMPTYLQSILNGKRLLLLRKMMDAAGARIQNWYRISCGFNLMDWQPASDFIRRVSVDLRC